MLAIPRVDVPRIVLHPAVDGRTPVEVFQEIFLVFLGLGTLVGVVVIGYMLYNAYKYRDGDHRQDDARDRPQLGEIPTGGGGGKKLFVSFGISAIIVISLIFWTYGMLMHIDQEQPAAQGEAIEINVTGYRFGWQFAYEDGPTTRGELRVPVDEPVKLRVNSTDVFHSFGIPDLRVKTDAIPGQTTTAWFLPTETGTYEAKCYELCGAGHSSMTAQVIVMEPGAYQDWLQNQTTESNT